MIRWVLVAMAPGTDNSLAQHARKCVVGRVSGSPWERRHPCLHWDLLFPEGGRPRCRQGCLRSQEGATPGTRAGAGFTLLELVIATMLLVIGLVAITRAYARGIAATEQSEAYMTATLLAREKLAELEGTQELQNGTESGDVAEPYTGYRWETEIGDETTIEDMKRIRIGILWSRSAHEYQVSLETCLYKPPPPEETERGAEEEQPEETGQAPSGAGIPSGMPSVGAGGGGFSVPGMDGGGAGGFSLPDFGAGGGG